MRKRMILLALLSSAWLSSSSPAQPVFGPPVTTAVGAPSAAPPEARLVVWNRTITVFRAFHGELSPAERAANSADRIDRLPELSQDWDLATMPVQAGETQGIVITAHGTWLFGLVPGDLDPESNETLESAAQASLSRLREMLEARAEARLWPVRLRAGLYSILATLGFFVFVWLVARARRFSLSSLQRAIAARRTRLAVKGLELGAFLLTMAKLLLRIAAFTAWAAGAYVWLTFVLIEFPYTRPWGEQLGTYLSDSLTSIAGGVVAAVPGLFIVAVIVLVTRLITHAVSELFLAVESGRLVVEWLEAETARATRRLVIVVIWAIAVMLAYPNLPGADTAAFKGISVVIGLMISLGSTGLINQVLSGFVIIYSRSVKPGEYVKVQEVEGVVAEVGFLATKIRTRRREEISVPNSLLAASTTINFSRLAADKGEVLFTTLTIGYDAPWRQVHSLLLAAADRTEGIRKDPPPRVLQRSLSDFFVEYQLLAHLEKSEGRALVLSALHENIQDAFNEHGVQIMSPHFEAQPTAPVVVPRDRWFDKPAEHAAKDGEKALRQPS
jgi:small-conductance mechanosensitive channel